MSSALKTRGLKSAATLGVAALALLAVGAVSSCSLPRVYRLTVQQGNVITQEMVDSLKPGMTREQVAFIMGEPVIRNPFDDSRWDYVYTLRVPGYVDDNAKLSVFFVDGALTHFSGDFKPTTAVVAGAPGAGGSPGGSGREDR